MADAAPSKDAERQKNIDDATTYMVIEGSKAAAVATVGVVAFHFAANAVWPRYKKFAMGPKLFWLSSAVVAAYWIVAEQKHLERQREMAARDFDKIEAADRERARLLRAASKAQQVVNSNTAPAAGKQMQ